MQLIFDFPINPRYTFDNFVICPGNATALQFAKRLQADVGENLLYVHGPEGSGKTHLLQALANEVGDKGDGGQPYLSCGALEKLYEGAFPAEGASRMAEYFQSASALIVDDIHLLPAVDSIRTEFWQLFNDFYSCGKKIAVAGPCPPKELANVDEHITSRLLWGLVAGMDVSGDDSRLMILAKLAQDRQIVLPDDVATYLVTHARRDVPSLAAALDLLRRAAFTEKRKITLPLARQALSFLR
jgi:chromosomal replication initiator protein